MEFLNPTAIVESFYSAANEANRIAENAQPDVANFDKQMETIA